MTDIVVVRDTTTRAEIAEILALANADAKAISRRGMTAMLRPEYADAHETIDALLTDWLAAP
jgi:hypothetical protein